MSDTSLTLPGEQPATKTWARRLGVVGVLAGAGLVGLTLPASAASASTWDTVAQCESSGNWSINTGNGYFGGCSSRSPPGWPTAASSTPRGPTWQPRTSRSPSRKTPSQVRDGVPGPAPRSWAPAEAPTRVHRRVRRPRRPSQPSAGRRRVPVPVGMPLLAPAPAPRGGPRPAPTRTTRPASHRTTRNAAATNPPRSRPAGITARTPVGPTT